MGNQRSTTQINAQRVAVIAMFVVAAIVYVAFIARCAFEIDDTTALTLLDDAMISMRYARNLAEHGELTWNLGDPNIEGYTNLLWTLWMAGVHMLPLGDLHTAFAVSFTGALLLLGTGWCVLGIARHLRLATVTRVIALSATLSCYGLVYWTLRGMEAGLLAWLATAGALLLLRLSSEPRAHYLRALLMCAVASLLTRTDSIVFVIVWIGFAATLLPAGQRRRVALALAAVTVATLLGHTIFRLTYYGEWMPNTYYLKLEGVALDTRLYRGFSALIRLLHLGWFVPCVMAAFAFASRDQRPAKLLLALQVVACAAYSVYVGGDAWEEFGMPNRYLCAAVPALMLLAAMGGAHLVTTVAHRRVFVLLLCALAALQLHELVNPSVLHARYRPDSVLVTNALWTLACAAVCIVRPKSEWLLGAILLYATSAARWSDWWDHGAVRVDVDIRRVRHGLAIRASTSEDATIAAAPCGSIPYFARRRTLDLLGKSDRRIAHEPPRTSRFHPGHTKWNYAYSIGELQPDLVDELFIPPDRRIVDNELAAMAGWGYEQVIEQIYVRRASGRVDVQRLLRELGREPR